MSQQKYLNQVMEVEVDQYRPLAFFGINIEQEDENIAQWVRWCKRQGFRGFNIIVGSDCEGRAHEDWINKLLHKYEVAIKTAEDEELEVWIFDDWGYPSGTAGGLVCTEPSFRLKRLDIGYDCALEQGQTITIDVPDRYVAASVLLRRGEAIKLDLTPGQQFTYTASDQAVRLVVVVWNYDPHQAKSNCKSFPGDPAMSCIDMLNPEATRRFLSVMHERYYEHLKPYMGTVIKGFFYDEPYLPYEFPWTEKLPETFMERKGYDLLTILPELLVKTHTTSRGPVVGWTDDFFDVWTDMAAENYYGEMRKWCDEHGLELSGHQDLDHHLNTMSTISGHFYKDVSRNHRPAVDVIWAQIAPGEFSDFPRYAGSIKYLLGREYATSETFAGMGYGLSGDLMRFITDHEVIRGINDFHLMYSSNRVSPNEYSPQMPHHMLQEPFGPDIYHRIGTSAAIGSLGAADINIAVYMPAFDFNRAQLGLRRTGITNAERLPWDWVDEIAEYLTYAPYDFTYLWQEALLELEIESGGLQTKSGAVIDHIIIPPGTTLGEEVLAKLEQFAAQGGKVIMLFKPIWSLANKAVMCNVVKDLEQFLPARVQIEGCHDISLSTRIIGNKEVYLLLNESDEAAEGVEVKLAKSGQLSEVNLADLSLLPVTGSDAGYVMDFLPMQLRVFILDTSGDRKVFIAPNLLTDSTVMPTNWQVTLPDSKVQSLSGNDFPDWAKLGHPTFSGSMTYTAEFEWSGLAEQAMLTINELYSHAQIYLNDQHVANLAYRPYSAVISGLTPGKHKLQVKVYNTQANEVCGTLEVEQEKYHGRFANLAHYDRRRIKSGLLEPVRLIPIK